MRQDAIRAFKHSLPCLITYLFLGMAIGINLYEIGYNWLFSLSSAVFLYSGSLQLMMISFLKSQEPLYIVALITFIVNARYAFYGISFVDRFKGFKWYQKIYMTHVMSDEAYSLFCVHVLPFKEPNRRYMLLVGTFNHVYWIIGCALGSLIAHVSGNPEIFKGLDFILTSLFTIVFIDQLRSNSNHLPSIIGLGSAALSMLICRLINFEYFIIPAIVLSIILLFSFKDKIEKAGDAI